jgi:hypothetical protein
MNNFIKAMSKTANQTFTENGMSAVKSTTNSIVDLFGVIGSLRTRSEDEIIDLFVKSYYEDKLLTLKMLFYARDIRGGLGERRTFKIIAKYLANRDPETMKLNLHLIPEYGRWDDLYAFVGTKLEKDVFALIAKQIMSDLETVREAKKSGTYKPISLAAKWLKSIQSKSAEYSSLAKLTAREIGLYNPKGQNVYEKYCLYTKAMSTLRAYLKITESYLSQKNVEDIDFSQVPSIAMKKYKKAFMRRVPELYNQYLKDVETGKAEIKASALYPYDLIKPYLNTLWGWNNSFKSVDQTTELQWKALPNYVSGENDFLVMPDLSGSMMSSNGRPMATSIGLAIYFAERNKGAYHNTCLSFSSEPSWITFNDNMNLSDKLRHLCCNANVGFSTNIEAAMQMILDSAIQNNLKSEDLPKSLIIISDMEFDVLQRGSLHGNKNFYDEMSQRFEAYGYTIPNIVFWNVDSRNNVFHIDRNALGVQLASGSHPSVFKSLIENIALTPYDMVVNTLNTARYNVIKVAE